MSDTEGILPEGISPDPMMSPDAVDPSYSASSDVQFIRKSFAVTGDFPRTGPGPNALMIEDLSGTLAWAEIQAKRQLHFWNDIPKRKTWNRRVEYSALTSLSDLDGMDGFAEDGDSGYTSDMEFDRAFQVTKFMLARGYVSLAAEYVKLVTPEGVRDNAAMEFNQTNKMVKLLVDVERMLFWGSENYSSLQWNGMFAQIDDKADASNQIRLNLQGRTINQAVLTYAAQILSNNSAELSRVYLPNEAVRDLQQSLIDSQTAIGQPFRGGQVGAIFDEFVLTALNGDPKNAKLVRTQMLTPGVKNGIPWKVPTRASKYAPLVCQVPTGSGGAFTTTDANGRPGLQGDTYYYSVCAVGKGGRSLAVSSAAITCTDNQRITLQIANSDESVKYYEVYRNKFGTSGVAVADRYFLTWVKRTGEVTTFYDDGWRTPDTYDIACLDMEGSAETSEIVFNQLIPPIKRPLPNDALGTPFAIVLCGAPVMRVPIHNLHICNIGKRPQSGVATLGDPLPA
jgi:hypothetical protein